MSKTNLGKGDDSNPGERGRGDSNSWRKGWGSSSRSGGRGEHATFFSDRESKTVSWLKKEEKEDACPISSPSASVGLKKDTDSLSSSSSSSNVPSGSRKVRLSKLILDCYKESKKLSRSSGDWLIKPSLGGGTDIEERITYAKDHGLFAATGIVYSVIMLGSTRLSSRWNEAIETLVKELYDNGFTRIQHGVFAIINRGYPGDSHKKQYDKVADELAILFNEKQGLRLKTRRQWMETTGDGSPHCGAKYLSKHLVNECQFLISEYLKHAPSLGLSVEEYLDLTSTLYDHCNPNFGNIDQTKNYAFITPTNPSSKLSLYNKFTQETLSERLLSLPDPNQQFPDRAILQCNNSHDLCILTEIRYTFMWENRNLVSYKPAVVDCRMDYCKDEGSDHSYSYLTQRDRSILQNAILNDSSYGFYEIMPENVAQLTEDVAQLTQDVARMNQPKDTATLNQLEDDEWTVVRKGKGKRR